jgi:cytosine/uracil/thiamine/allantoin permease
LLDVSPRSAYWYKGGIEWRAFGAWALAIVLGFCFLSTGAIHGIFADSWFGRNGLGWIVTFVVAAGVYALLGGARGATKRWKTA